VETLESAFMVDYRDEYLSVPLEDAVLINCGSGSTMKPKSGMNSRRVTSLNWIIVRDVLSHC
jgi:hypothetical protein